ncbi:glycosyltransferase [Winogradskyella vidalii]|uniref:glycosyltransferase n=1 Tax=Winogradskyella vidalii TaxID=2615024 RepID=UPI0015CA574E|nr:glycosyltransferase [Winogradskyella vidalii]
MHILIIPSWYKTPNNPIVGTFFEEQARMFLKRGHQVGILFPKHNLRFKDAIRLEKIKTPDSYLDEGIPTVYAFSQSFIPKVVAPTKIDVFQCCAVAYKKYKIYVERYGKPDVIHAHSMLWGGVVGSYISKKESIPLYFTKHATGWILDKKRLTSNTYKDLLAKTINQSKKTFVVSSFYKNELLEHYEVDKHKMSVIHNIVSSLFFATPQTIQKSKPIKLIVIAYLIERKNHLTLFKAIKLLKNEGVSIVLTVIGSGPYMGVLKDFVKEEELVDNIQFLGLLDRHNIVDEIKKSHIVVSSSIFETFGVNIIEGLACGRPCVVLDSGGPRDIVRKNDGILFKDNTPIAFAKAIKTVIDNYNSYDQMEIINSCRKRFGEDQIYQELLTKYEMNATI